MGVDDVASVAYLNLIQFLEYNEIRWNIISKIFAVAFQLVI